MVEDQTIGRVLAGKYRIDAFIKGGGMGAVYRATHLMLAKPVAIKLIKPELVTSEDTVQRFQREARAASHLSHPNIVTVHDLGRAEDGTLYIAMELLDGESLKEAVKRQGPFEPERAVRITRAIASALAHAHQHSVIHRDLKPQNIMLTRDGEGHEIPKLLDFGIAKTFETDAPALTSTGMVLGTPQYMSPEQAEGRPVDARSDLYALGIILYEMLVGKVPFDDKSIPAILIKHLNEAPQPPSKLRGDIPASLERIVLRCLEKDPAERFASAVELLSALDEAASVQTVPAEEGPTIGVAALAEEPPTQVPASKPSIAAVPTLPPPPRPVRAPVRDVTLRAQRRRSFPWVLGILALFVLAAAAGVGVFFLLRGGTEKSDSEPSQAALSPYSSAASTEPSPAEPKLGEESSVQNPPPDASTPVAPTSSGAGGGAAQQTGTSATPTAGEPPSSVPHQRAAEPSPRSQPSQGTAPATSPPPPRQAPSPPAAPPLPSRPPVSADCQGLADACAAFKAALHKELDKAGLPYVRQERAEIVLSVLAEEVEQRAEQQFGTTFVVRTYSIDVSAEAPRFGEIVSMPPPEILSFDTRFGRDKLNEGSRSLAASVTAKIVTYWSRKHN